MQIGGRFTIKKEVLDSIVQLQKWMLLIRQDHKPLKTKSGIHIVDAGLDSTKSSMNPEGRRWMPTGIVTHIGPDCRSQIKIGDRVFFGSIRGLQQIDCDGELYHLIKEVDIMAIIDKEGDYIK
jgi:co-chaperonin GroES (HSP10)